MIWPLNIEHNIQVVIYAVRKAKVADTALNTNLT